MTTWLSRRAYGRTRNLSEAVVRRHIASGLLAPAVDPATNLIDADKADQLLLQNVTRKPAKKVPPVLRVARQRHRLAIAHDLDDQVGDLELVLIPPAWFESFTNSVFDEITNPLIAAWPEKIAPALIGHPAEVVQRLLKEGIHDLLGELHEVIVEGERRSDQQSLPKPTKPPLDTLSAVELEAHIESQRARLLELARLERRGKLVRVQETVAASSELVIVAKQQLLAIPGRTDVTVAGSKDVEEIVALLKRETDDIVASLHFDVSSLVQPGGSP